MRFFIALIIGILAFILNVEAKRKTHRGMGTAYSGPFKMDKTGKNACQFNRKKLPKQWQIYYAAMNQKDWKKMGSRKGICGKCIAVRGVKGHTTRGHRIKTVYAKIVDLCPSWACKKGNVDFSTTALKAITGYSWDKKKITWRYTTCPDERRSPPPPRRRSPPPPPPRRPSPPPPPPPSPPKPEFSSYDEWWQYYYG
ncbi:hypothetical protein M9434_000977 [Picochlorum sp. BPE23]|nr:hypothetical protein M9434_000977 [Picochlorum sp. BPE23]KAI8111718.1 hypothetical protein M9435_004217 [Picochlorum sp. BPE23]